MDERGNSGHADGPDESGHDAAQDAWTEDDLDHEAGDVEDDDAPEDEADQEPGGDQPEDDAPEDEADQEPGGDQPEDDGPEDEGWDEDADQESGEHWYQSWDEDWDEDWDDDWDEDGAGEEAQGNPRWWLTPAFFAGAVAGMVVIALLWLVTATGSDAGSRDTSNAVGAGDRSTASPEKSLDERREQRCTDTAAAMHDALRAAGPALDQWEVHVGAMNKLVVGAITLQQANQFWNQTRVGAHQSLARFRAADHRLARRSRPCPSPDHLGGTPAALRSCARVVARDRAALAVARRSIDTWSHHVHDMDMLRMGHMSPAMATQMWLASWKQGVRELDAYRSAVRTQHRQRCSA